MSENCDKLKGLPGETERSKYFHINVGLSHAMNAIARSFEFDSHVDFTEALKEAGYL